MPRRIHSDEDLAGLRKTMAEMTTTRLGIFEANATRYAAVLGAFKAALEKSGFSAEESMQVVLKVLEQPNRRLILRREHVGR